MDTTFEALYKRSMSYYFNIYIYERKKKLFGSSISVFVIRCHGKHFPRNVFN